MLVKSKSLWKKFSQTMFSRILTVMFCMIFLLAFLYFMFFCRGRVIPLIEEYSLFTFSERTRSLERNIQSKMNFVSTRLHETEPMIAASIEETLAKHGAQPKDIFSDPELNREILSGECEKLITLMHQNDINGVFLVLDGPYIISNDGRQSDESSRAGIYISNTSGSPVSADNSNIFLKRGLPDISKKYRLALETAWQAGFNFGGKSETETEFFYKPLEVARRYNGYGLGSYYGRWSTSFKHGIYDPDVIAYSVPIIAQDKTVIGVLGVEYTSETLISLLSNATDETKKDYTYFVGITENEGKSYSKVFCAHALKNAYDFGEQDETLILGADRSKNIRSATDFHKKDFFACVAPISIYSNNTPFIGEQWALIEIVQEEILFEDVAAIERAAYIWFFITLVLGMIGVAFIALLFTSPISNLSTVLRAGAVEGRINLKKINIKEIDELSSAIMALSSAVAESSERMVKVYALAPVDIGVFEYSTQSPTVFCSSRLCPLFGWDNITDEAYFYMPREEFESRVQKIDNNILNEGQITLQIDSGETRWLRIDTILQDGKLFGAVTDITAEIKEKRRIEFERDYDLLTGLYNLRAFNMKFGSVFSGEDVGISALIMWDLDNLKYINDTFGHDYGDRYICSFADQLKELSHHNAIIARRSGDEFYTFLYNYSSRQEIMDIVNSFWMKLERVSIALPDGNSVRVRVSGGIAWYPDDAQTADMLLRYSDFAMYRAKHDLKGSISFFDDLVYRENAYILNGYELITKLIEDELVRFAMQPIVSTRDGSVYGYELLMRPQIEGINNPRDLIRMAQTHSKLYHIEQLTLFKGMAAFVEKIKAGYLTSGEKVFINSLGNQRLIKKDADRFYAEFDEYMDRVVLEITEEEQGSRETNLAKVEGMHSHNAMIAIDDYGSGYNSESILVYLAPDIVKVDITIIRGIDKDTNRQNLLDSIVSYAKKQNVAVLAEGIETKEELETCILSGVDYLQGYYIGRPNFDIIAIPDNVIEEIRAAHSEYILQRKNVVVQKIKE